VRVLSTADERRSDVVAAAMTAFAVRGYFGTNTTEIARAAGISQAYLYRLYANKEELFVAVLDAAKQRIRVDLERALSGVEPESVDGVLVRQAVEDREVALVLLHAAAACGVPQISRAVQACYREQLEFLRSRGASDAGVRQYLAQAQYVTVLRAADIPRIDDLKGLVP
jgi:AcrR family transcriptional regulator